jgi:hypothetical protein
MRAIHGTPQVLYFEEAFLFWVWFVLYFRDSKWC